MKLTSINVSLAVDAKYNGKTVRTGIFKKPITGDVHIGINGLENDQQVDLENHGGGHKAVYAFSTHHYKYWSQELDQELHYGQFGENLTITDLDETLLCIGDQLQIGGCILEITQPRVPCFKLGMVLNLTTMPKLFIQHAATGIYFKVLKVGSVKMGDTVSHIYSHPKQLSVRTLFKAYFDKDFIDTHKTMLIAESINELSDEWREKVIARLNKV